MISSFSVMLIVSTARISLRLSLMARSFTVSISMPVQLAIISAVVGFVFGGGLAVLSRLAMTKANLTVLLTPNLVAVTAVLTLVMCCAASMLSVIKVLRLDPASVFKG